MKIDSPKSIFNPACAEKISIFSAHAGCALPGASRSLRASSLSGQDFKPTIQAKGLAAYGSLGWFIRSVGKDSSLRGGLKRGQRMMLNWRGFVCPSIFSKIGF